MKSRASPNTAGLTSTALIGFTPAAPPRHQQNRILIFLPLASPRTDLALGYWRGGKNKPPSRARSGWTMPDGLGSSISRLATPRAPAEDNFQHVAEARGVYFSDYEVSACPQWNP
jgi:hypothetical protein